MVSPEVWLLRRPDDSEASVPGIGADSIRHGDSGTDSGRHVAGTGASRENLSQWLFCPKKIMCKFCFYRSRDKSCRGDKSCRRNSCHTGLIRLVRMLNRAVFEK